MAKHKETVPASNLGTCTTKAKTGTYLNNEMKRGFQPTEYKKGQKIRDCVLLYEVEEKLFKSGQKRRVGLFKCFCGNEFKCYISTIVNGRTNSCGCLKHKPCGIKYNEGDKLGNCFFIRDVSPNENNPWLRRAMFKCFCGKEFESNITSVKSKKAKSCGCRRGVERMKYVNGIAFKELIPEYRAWANMKTRCYNSKVKRFENHGGRGIKVCDRWFSSFENFFLDMGKKPSSKHSIDRKDNDGNYTPENCRWATNKEQSLNRRSNIRITFNGETKTLSEWKDILNISRTLLYERVKSGKSVDDIFIQHYKQA